LGDLLLAEFRSSFIDGAEFEIRFIDANGGMDRQRKFELSPPVREYPNKLQKSAFPYRSSEDFYKQLLPDS
jgi:hypothetical protein